MATSLFDTTVLIDLARGIPDAIRIVGAEEETGSGPAISIVSSMEMVVGCRDKDEVRRVQMTLARFAVLPLTPAVSQLAYDWIVQYSKSHGLTIPDALIAATAMDSSLILVTSNDRHFDMLPGLTIKKPY